jgi:hypothetical protein
MWAVRQYEPGGQLSASEHIGGDLEQGGRALVTGGSFGGSDAVAASLETLHAAKDRAECWLSVRAHSIDGQSA